MNDRRCWPTMDLLRSEPMQLVQLIIPLESAYRCVSYLGDLGLFQFKDLNDEKSPFQRTYATQLKRCGEMARKLRFLKEQMTKAGLSPSTQYARIGDVDLDSLEVKLGELESELIEINANNEVLQRKYNELLEYKLILQKAGEFFQSAQSGAAAQQQQLQLDKTGERSIDSPLLMEQEMMTDPSKQFKLGFISGLVPREKSMPFERILFRATRGNVYLKQSVVENPVVDPASGEKVEKNVFVVFYSGERSKNKILKICDAFGANRYPFTEDLSNQLQMITEVSGGLSELKTTIDIGLAHRSNLLQTIGFQLEQWSSLVKREKSIYHTLNMLNIHVTRKCLVGEGWCPVFATDQIQGVLQRAALDSNSPVGPIFQVLQTKELPPTYFYIQKRLNGVSSASSTMDLLAVLSATLATSSPDALAILSQRSCQSSDSEKSKVTSPDHVTGPNLHKQLEVELRSTGGERSSSCYNSPAEDSDCQIQETRSNLPLQLFSSSPETESPPKLAASRKYFSSDSSNPMEDGSPSSSPPVVQKLFPLKSTAGTLKSEKMSTSREGNKNGQSSRTHGSILPLELFSQSNREAEHISFKNLPYQAGYTSSSGSDHSPSSQNSDSQDRTGRIIFKLFDKDPSHFPGTLRTQIYNWLSNSPSEMESYIRPGCVVLSVYLSMSSTAWKQLEGNLLRQVDFLVQDPESDVWRSARFLLNTGRQLASYNDGKIRLCKSWRTWNSPELMSVSPVAVVSGQETSLLLKGRNVTNPGTRVHCTYMGGYASKEVTGFCNPGSTCNELNIDGFKIPGGAPTVLGRCFIEVENGFKGNSFPVIIADSSICKELRLLESELDQGSRLPDIASEEQANDIGLPRSREEVLHFLNELGWLFQRKSQCSIPELQDYSLVRFKFLLIFSVERDYCALVKTILGMLVERNMEMDSLSKESMETLLEVQLLNRAVKRRCRKMIDLLIHYSIAPSDSSSMYIFPPNLVGAGGITPLHLAACAPSSDDLVDSLTNDPHEIGLSSWDTLQDANGQSPYTYAVMANNHSYNALVARKLADKRNGQVSVTIGNEMVQRITTQPFQRGRKSCAKCATVSAKFQGRIRGSHALLHRPYVHSMLAIAAVCVCVCLFLRGAPNIGSVAPFKWENLDFGTI